MTNDPFDGNDVLLRFTPLAPDPAELHPSCPDEFVVVKISASMPAGIMMMARWKDKWEANAHWCYRHAVRWMLAEIERQKKRADEAEAKLTAVDKAISVMPRSLMIERISKAMEEPNG